jgi:hypothetical protein
VVRHASLINCEVSKLLTLIDQLFYPYLTQKERKSLSWLRLSVVEGLAVDVLCRTNEKARVDSWFEKNFREFFPDGTLRDVVAKHKKRPDFLLEIDGEIIPRRVQTELWSIRGKAVERLYEALEGK